MRTIKIILGAITALSLIFFSTGLFVKKTEYSTEIRINKNVEEVMNLMIDPNETKNWIPDIKQKNVVKSNKGVTGSIYDILIVNNDQEIKMTEQVMAYVPNEKLTLFYDAENMLKTNDFLFTKEAQGTKITLNATCKSDSYIMSCLFPYFKGTFRQQDLDYLMNLKKYIENK